MITMPTTESDESAPEPDVTPPRPSVLRAILGPAVFLGFMALKFAKVAFIALKSIKYFGTAASMVVSIAAYALLFGWPFAVGFVLLIFVHELGHAVQLRREGVAAGAPVFIPFVGAVIAMREMPRNAAMEARVGIAGPILGSVGAGVVHAAALATGSDMLLALAFTGYFLNLFNLVPVSPLDGGRIAAALSPKLWAAGIAIMLLLFLARPNPVLLLIIIVGGMDSWRRWKERSEPEAAAYYRDVPVMFRRVLGFTWIGLIVALVFAMQVSHVPQSL